LSAVGGTKRISVDIRIVAATNHDLHELIRTGKFRSDLYYRIATVEINLPPLRQRAQDIPYLAEFFIDMYAERYHKRIDGISPAVMQRWLSYDWPGNIRELQNVIHQAVLMCTGSRIENDTMLSVQSAAAPYFTAPYLAAPGQVRSARPSPLLPFRSYRGMGHSLSARLLCSLKDVAEAAAAFYERQRIESVLALAGGNKSRTAKALGITRKMLAKKIPPVLDRSSGFREVARFSREL